MNVETGAEAAQFPEKEYINGIAVAMLNTIRDLSDDGCVSTSAVQWQLELIVVRSLA